jgi:hypothetical protein
MGKSRLKTNCIERLINEPVLTITEGTHPAGASLKRSDVRSRSHTASLFTVDLLHRLCQTYDKPWFVVVGRAIGDVK